MTAPNTSLSEQLHERMAEAIRLPPNSDFWLKLTEIMRESSEIDRVGKSGNPRYNDRRSSQFLLHNLLKLLSEQRYFKAHQDYLIPLGRLSTATLELDHGRVGPMLTPNTKNKNNAGQLATHAAIKGMAARALSCLIEGGMPREQAARTVSGALRSANAKGLSAGTRSLSITWKTVAGWRDKMNEGPDDKESIAMRLAYDREIGPEFGSAPLEQGLSLVEELRASAAAWV